MCTSLEMCTHFVNQFSEFNRLHYFIICMSRFDDSCTNHWIVGSIGKMSCAPLPRSPYYLWLKSNKSQLIYSRKINESECCNNNSQRHYESGGNVFVLFIKNRFWMHTFFEWNWRPFSSIKKLKRERAKKSTGTIQKCYLLWCFSTVWLSDTINAKQQCSTKRNLWFLYFRSSIRDLNICCCACNIQKTMIQMK